MLSFVAALAMHEKRGNREGDSENSAMMAKI